MTLEILFFLALLAALVVVLVTDALSAELAAFSLLLILIFTGYVEIGEAFAGFSSPTVISIFSIFFISGALKRTGMADAFGRAISRLAGGRESVLLILLMLFSALLSAFMNNVAAAAMMMPAAASIAAHSGLSPSRLFMPLAFAVILGGTLTLVGTPPNLLANDALLHQGLRPLGLFDFTPIGIALVVAGIVYCVGFARPFLPQRVPARQPRGQESLTQAYRLGERLTALRVPAGSALAGRSLRDSRLGSALDVVVVAIERGKKRILAPDPDFVLAGEDLLLVDEGIDDLRELLGIRGVAVIEAGAEALAGFETCARGLILGLPAGSGLIGKSLAELRFRERFGVLVVGIRREGRIVRSELARRILRPTDEILALGPREVVSGLGTQKGVSLRERDLEPAAVLDPRFFFLKIPSDSPLIGRSIRSSRLGELAGITVIGLFRGRESELTVGGEATVMADDSLLVATAPSRVIDLLALGEISLESQVEAADLESEAVRVTEAVVAPRSPAAGATLRELRFRDRFGLQVLGLWRGGEVIAKELANRPLRVGDALLLQGPREQVARLAAESEDFVVLDAPERLDRRGLKGHFALGALILVIALVVTGIAPMHLAAFAGAVLTVLSGAITMQEAYRFIEWRTIHLIAAVWPLGAAMERSGTAAWLAAEVASQTTDLGNYALLALLVVLSSLLSQLLDGAPAVTLLAPVVIATAFKLGVSPYPLMVGVGLAASATFMSPFSHKVNLLVMGAGGYRSSDFFRIGTPLTLLMLLILVVLIPVFFPF